MRVTANTFPNSLLSQLSHLANRQNNLQSQAATGQKLTLPEDDPTAMRRVLDMQAEAAILLQYGRDIDRHKEIASTAFSAFKGLKKLNDRAEEIAILADGLKSPTELAVYANEINEMLRQAAQHANTQNRGDYIFGGTVGDRPAFTLTQDPNGLVTGVTYNGNTTTPQSDIAPGVSLSSYTVGANTSGSGPTGLITDSRTGADLFNHLISLRDHLQSGDLAGIEADRVNLGKDESNLITHMSTNGTLQARLEATQALGNSRLQSIEKLVSNEADADLAQTLVRLNEVQTAYQAALQSGGTILNKSLLDYLR
jgi:flagellar hook-associated protein 3 FlgL